MLGSFKANAFEVVDYAYGDPGDGNVSPELGSLGLLAAGAAGLLACRAERKRLA